VTVYADDPVEMAKPLRTRVIETRSGDLGIL